ncbi:hypothetical protein K2W90_05260 [Candidatus Babeliales bacterium]|nr:hypothetical protein [Candidatus Babeliales bacterium]
MKKFLLFLFFASLFSQASCAASFVMPFKKLFGPSRKKRLAFQKDPSPRGLEQQLNSEDGKWTVFYKPGKLLIYARLAIGLITLKDVDIPDDYPGVLTVEVIEDEDGQGLCIIKDSLLWLRFSLAELEQILADRL